MSPPLALFPFSGLHMENSHHTAVLRTLPLEPPWGTDSISAVSPEAPSPRHKVLSGGRKVMGEGKRREGRKAEGNPTSLGLHLPSTLCFQLGGGGAPRGGEEARLLPLRACRNSQESQRSVDSHNAEGLVLR
jgi:hypothetical protein